MIETTPVENVSVCDAGGSHEFGPTCHADSAQPFPRYVKLGPLAPTVTLFQPGLSGGGCVVSSGEVVVTIKASAVGVNHAPALTMQATTANQRSEHRNRMPLLSRVVLNLKCFAIPIGKAGGVSMQNSDTKSSLFQIVRPCTVASQALTDCLYSISTSKWELRICRPSRPKSRSNEGRFIRYCQQKQGNSDSQWNPNSRGAFT